MVTMMKSTSLKNRLIFYFILVAFIPAIFISIYHYVELKNVLEESVGVSNYKIVSNIVENIDNRIQQADQLSDWVHVDKDIISLLNRKREDAIKFDTVKSQAIENIQKQFEYLPVTNYILSFFIIGDNGTDLRNGREAFLIGPDSFINEDWYRKGIEADGKIYWGSISGNYTKITNNRYIIPFVRQIKDINNEGRTIGCFICFFDESMIRDLYRGVIKENGDKIMLVDQYGNVISANDTELIGSNVKDKEYFRKLMDSSTDFFQIKDDEKYGLVTFKKSPCYRMADDIYIANQPD